MNGASDEEVQKLTIKVSGCPNSCAQHHIATIGFHGVAHKIDGRLLPAYQLHLGGRITPGGVQFGQQFPLKFPAKRVPEVVGHLLQLYRTERQPGESFLDYVDRNGKTRFQQELLPFTKPTGQKAEEELFHDWDDPQDYSLTDHGAGECASAAVNFVTQHFEDSAYELAHAQVLLLKARPLDAITRADLALVAAAKALLTLEEIEPLSFDEALREFEARFMTSGRLPRTPWATAAQQRRQRGATPLTVEAARSYVGTVRQLIEACRAYYEQIAGEPATAPAQAAPLDSPGD
jgi:sulfite reductase (ferredoxin)